jgi:hypothetical protein
MCRHRGNKVRATWSNQIGLAWCKYYVSFGSRRKIRSCPSRT